MTPKENLMRALSGGSPEWMPACVHIANTNNLPGFLPQELLAQPLDRLRIGEFTGGDVLYEIGAIRTRMPAGFESKTIAAGDSRTTTLTTPMGCLAEEVLLSRSPSPAYPEMPPGYAVPEPVATSVHTRHFIASLDDYAILRSYFEAQVFEADNARIASEMVRVGEKGVLVLGGGPSSPLYSLVSAYAGIERLTYDLCDAPDAVESAMAAMREAACRWYEAAAGSACDVIRCTEDLDTKLVSPEMFRKYAAPALAEYARICHARGKLFVVHMCGHIREFLADVRDAGADAIHCLTLPPTGNTPLPEARRVLAGRTAAMIRVDPEALLRGDAGQADAFVAGVVEGIGDWRNVMIIIPCGRAPLGNIRRVIEQAHKLARWAS